MECRQPLSSGAVLPRLTTFNSHIKHICADSLSHLKNNRAEEYHVSMKWFPDPISTFYATGQRLSFNVRAKYSRPAPHKP